MPLGNIDEWFRWIERERPSRRALSVARTFLAEIGDEPWRAPSVPIPELSQQPYHETRSAALRVEGEPDVELTYRVHYEAGRTDLVGVRQY